MQTEHEPFSLLDIDCFLDREKQTCPECEGTVRLYRWDLHESAVNILRDFYKLGRTTKYHLESELPSCSKKVQGNVTRLVAFNLIEKSDEGRGLYRCSDVGERFLKGEETVPQYVLIYKGKYFDEEGPQVDVSYCYGKYFDLEKHLA